MQTLNNIKKLIKEENKKQLNNTIQYFNEKTTLLEKEQYIANFYYSKSLNRVYKQNGARTELQKTKALIMLIKEHYNERLNNQFNKLNDYCTILNSDEKIKSISINIKWVYNKTWGYNPNASIYIDTTSRSYILTGSASGCGYDKRSSATAQAFNKSNLLLAMLAKLKNKNGVELPYGCGYGAIPYFEGAVGYNCHNTILNELGFKKVVENSTNTTDFYYYEASNK